MAALKTLPEAQRQTNTAQMSRRRIFKILKRPVVIAIAVALGRGNVAILDVVILDGRGLRSPGFAVILAGRLVLVARSAHVTPFGRVDRCRDLNLTVFEVP